MMFKVIATYRASVMTKTRTFLASAASPEEARELTAQVLPVEWQGLCAYSIYEVSNVMELEPGVRTSS
jgi:hypothetical protein